MLISRQQAALRMTVLFIGSLHTYRDRQTSNKGIYKRGCFLKDTFPEIVGEKDSECLRGESFPVSRSWQKT